MDIESSKSQTPGHDFPHNPLHQFTQFGAGCFWAAELAGQRAHGVVKTEVGFCQGYLHNPTCEDVCSSNTNHVEAVRLPFAPLRCSYNNLHDVFCPQYDPTTLIQQGGYVGTQYRSGFYCCNGEQAKTAHESMELHQQKVNGRNATEILPARLFYRAEDYHQ